MATKQTVIAQPFTNEFGTVNVGDTVMAVTTGYSHRVSVSKAKYVGYIESVGWRGNTVKKVKLDVEATRTAWFFKGTDNEFKWSQGNYYEVKDQLETRKMPYIRRTTLQLNRIAPIKASEHSIIETVGKLV